jgi:hypothetical protein
MARLKKAPGRLIGRWKQEAIAANGGASDEDLAKIINDMARKQGYDYRITPEKVPAKAKKPKGRKPARREAPASAARATPAPAPTSASTGGISLEDIGADKVQALAGMLSIGDEDDVEEGDGEGDSHCPYCQVVDAPCEHYLGSKDVHFCTGFGIDDGSVFEEMRDLFEELDQAVSAFLLAGNLQARIPALKPLRLRALLAAVTKDSQVRDGKLERDRWVDGRAFQFYLESALDATKVSVAVTSREENTAPGFSSVVKEFWASDATVAVAGLRKRVRQDIKRLTANR